VKANKQTSTTRKLSAVLLISIAAFVLTIIKSNDSMKQKSVTLVSSQEDLSVEQERSLVIADMRKKLEAFSELKSTVASVLPKGKNQAQIIAEINQIAADSNLAIDTLGFPDSSINASSGSGSPTQTKPVEGLSGVFEMQISLGGIKSTDPKASTKSGIEYSQVLSFIKGFEKNRRSTQIRSISLSPQLDSETNTYRYSLQINISVYIK
jgi:hypothetical protein